MANNKDFKSFAVSNGYKTNSYQNDNRKTQAQDFPKGYLEDGYFDDDKKEELKIWYIVEFSKAIKDGLINCGKDENKSTQLRKYYEFVVRIKDKIKYNSSSDINNNVRFEQILPEIHKLSYYANYAMTRGKVSKFFVDFIDKNINAIKDEKDFGAFATHFEAIIAYLPKGR